MIFTTTAFEEDHPIYRDVNMALDFAKELEGIDPVAQTSNIHMYWRVPREFAEKQAIALKSVIATHDLTKVTIFVWSNVDLSSNPHIQPMLPYITLKIYDPIQESKGTVLEGWGGLTAKDDLCWIDGDVFRLLILHKFGGIYIDFDVITLKSLYPLFGMEFMYQWGTSTINQMALGGMNGAVMGLVAGSQVSIDLLTEVKNTPIITGGTMFGSELYGRVRQRNKNWYIFPSGFFNTEWQCWVDGATFMKKCEQSTNLYEGAFTWHWHNKWDDVVEEGSKFDILSKITEDKFNKVVNNVL